MVFPCRGRLGECRAEACAWKNRESGSDSRESVNRGLTPNPCRGGSGVGLDAV